MPVSEGVAVASELVMTIVQAYILARRQEGVSDEQAKQEFPALCEKFLAESSGPVDPVNE